MKKLLAMLLATAIVLSSLGMVSFAAEANTNVYNGNYSTKMVVGSSFGSTCSYLTVSADTDYVVSWYSLGGGSKIIRAQGSTNYNWGEELGGATSATGDTWKENSFEFNSGSYTLIALVAVCNNYGGAGTGYIDDVKVVKKDDGSLVKFFDFEDGNPYGGKVSDFFDIETSAVVMKEGVATDEVNPDITEPDTGDGDGETTDPDTGDGETTDPDTGDGETTEPDTGDDDTTAEGKNLNVRQGHYSLAVNCVNTDNFKFFVSKAIRLEADTDYVLSAWTKGGGDTSIRILNSTSWSAVSETKGGSGGIWQQITNEFNSGSNTSVLFALTNNPYGGNGTRYYDDLVLYKKDDASMTNLIVDPGFEEGTGWTFKDTEAAFTKEYSAEEVVIEDEVYTYVDNVVEQPGGASWNMLYAGHHDVIFVPNGQVNTVSQNVSLDADTDYYASFWVRSPEGGKINLVIKDSTGAEVYTQTITGSNSWVRYTPTFTSAAAGTYLYSFESIADETAEVYLDYAMMYATKRIDGTGLKHLVTDHSFENEGTWDGITGVYNDGDTGAVWYVSNTGTMGSAGGGIRVMCVGDSITAGVGASSMVGGYKKALYDMYEGEGVDINFVGPSGLGEPNFDAGSGHAGYSGWRIDQIDSNIENWMNLYVPQAILLMIGTNDVLQDNTNNNYAANAPARLEALVDKIMANNPDVELFVASMPPLNNSGNDAKIQTINATTPDMVATKGDNVHFVDIYSAFPSRSDGIGSDYTHPDDKGYGYIANKWFADTKDVITSLPPSEFIPDDSIVYDGKYALKYNPWYVPYYTLLTYEMYTTGMKTVEPNTDYELSMMVKGDQSVSLQTRVQTSFSGGQLTALTTNAGPKWTKASTTFNTGDSTQVLLAMINSCMSTGTMYVDDIRLTNLSTGENILVNSSLEQSDDGSVEGWGTPKFPWSWVESDTVVVPPVEPEVPTEPDVPVIEGDYAVDAEVYDEAFEEDGKTIVEVTLAEGNGDKTVKVDGAELYYSVQNEVYVGLVDTDAIGDGVIEGLEILDAEPTLLVYGNVDGDYEYDDIEEAVDASDLQFLKKYAKGQLVLAARELYAADVDGDGLADASDLQILKRYLKSGGTLKFGVLK